MSTKGRGLYETLVTEALAARLEELEAGGLHIERAPLRPAEAADRIALHLSRVVERVIESLADNERVEVGTRLARRLIGLVAEGAGDHELGRERPFGKGELLHGVVARLPDGRPEPIDSPLIPLLDTTLLTNAPGEPRVGSQLLTEIASADRIDLVMAFIRRSGIRPFLEALRRHVEAGRSVRVLTTTYTGSTEGEALEQLQKLGAEVRVSYDQSSTRLHAKAWLFHRRSGFSTAYIGSSNLTHSAQVSGLEWNVRVSGARNRQVVEKVAAVFESYWNGGDFVGYEQEVFRAQSATQPKLKVILSPVELRPEPFQERLLEQIALARERGHRRNLLVAATGTGKTVMAALDYARLRQKLPRARLLFVAHRQEILEQSLATFRHALRDPAFGELWVGGHRPAYFDHVFASIQSLHANGLEDLAADHFDVVIVDEFHHAAALTYRNLLEHVQPRQLLGLTATPERADGLPILDLFGGRIAAELRLWDAIDQQRLAPFSYFGIHDGLDLRDIPWKRGTGYDVEALSNVMTGNDVWAGFVLQALRDKADDVSRMRALGFCVSVDHARYMARVFGAAGIAARAVWADTPASERAQALRDLEAGRIQVLFSVDLFNEGVDVPNVDSLLLLRPTESPVLFLQQLGRGLRRHPGKTTCLVLDFVGRHRSEFRFDRKLRALLGGGRSDVERQVEGGFPFLPAGCHMELDAVARDVVLRSIRGALPSQWPAKVEELRRMGGERSLRAYLEETGLDLEDVYRGGKSWSDLREAAGLRLAPPGRLEAILRRACGRLLHVDDDERIGTWCQLLQDERPPDVSRLGTEQRRLLRMLVAQVADQAVPKGATLQTGIDLLWAHPQVRSELVELFAILGGRVEHLTQPLQSHPHVPLRVHARYTRLEILAAFGMGEGAKIAAWQSGARWIPEERSDVFAFTLDKTSGGFSPTTRYRDYAISRDLIHWESQSVTREDGETGMRYREHAARGSHVMLFARHSAADRSFYFLGPATYVGHEGELPMAITWRLEHPLPGDLFASFAAAVA